MKKIIFIFCTLFFCSSAYAITWHSHDSFQIDNLSLTRPDNTWRVAEFPDNNHQLVSLYRLRHGKDPQINIYKKRPFSTRLKNGHKLKNKWWLTRFKKSFTKNYIEEGFRFYEFEVNENTISAKASDADDNLLLLHIEFNRPFYSSPYYLLEMKLPRKEYTRYGSGFEKLTKSIQLKN
jgi:hypothetical protein